MMVRSTVQLDRIALVAGSGRYPEILIKVLREHRVKVGIMALPGFDPKDQFSDLIDSEVTLENFCQCLAQQRQNGCQHLAFAGGVQRPNVPSNDTSDMLIDIYSGDDTVLRDIVAIAENEGFEIIGGHELAPDCFLAGGNWIPTRHQPNDGNRRDIQRAVDIVDAMGRVDVGQAAVVVCQLCVAIETLSGTDAMLKFAAQTINDIKPLPNEARGVVYKGAKPHQELRLDMPSIGPQTIRQVHQAGLAGIAVEANRVLLLDRQDIIAEADRLGVFIWSLNKSDL